MSAYIPGSNDPETNMRQQGVFPIRVDNEGFALLDGNVYIAGQNGQCFFIAEELHKLTGYPLRVSFSLIDETKIKSWRDDNPRQWDGRSMMEWLEYAGYPPNWGERVRHMWVETPNGLILDVNGHNTKEKEISIHEERKSLLLENKVSLLTITPQDLEKIYTHMPPTLPRNMEAITAIAKAIIRQYEDKSTLTPKPSAPELPKKAISPVLIRRSQQKAHHGDRPRG